MKILVLLVVLVVAVAWIMVRGGRNKRSNAPPPPKADSAAAAKPAEMLACSHCGVHLPRADAAFDAAGRPFCGAEHRVAGPR